MKSLSRHFTLALLLSALAVASPALQAQEFKAGFVNTDRIFREATTAKAAKPPQRRRCPRSIWFKRCCKAATPVPGVPVTAGGV